MKVIVTGATGALGSVLVKYFSAKGHDVIAVGRHPKPPEELLKYATYQKADITKDIELPDAEVCIHAAALSQDAGRVGDFFRTNVDGTLNVMRATNFSTTFVYVSSSAVYLPAEVPITEDMASMDNLKKLTTYGQSKLLSEMALKDTFSGRRCFILRPRGLYGVGDIKILPRLLRLVRNGKLYKPGGLDVKVSITHYDNFCEAIDSCLESECDGVNVFNIADDRQYRLIEVVRKISSTLYGRTLQEKETPIWLLKLQSKLKRSGITEMLVRSLTRDMALDISKVKREIDYKGAVNLDTSMGQIKDWVAQIGGVEVLIRADKSLPWQSF